MAKRRSVPYRDKLICSGVPVHEIGLYMRHNMTDGHWMRCRG